MFSLLIILSLNLIYLCSNLFIYLFIYLFIQ